MNVQYKMYALAVLDWACLGSSQFFSTEYRLAAPAFPKYRALRHWNQSGCHAGFFALFTVRKGVLFSTLINIVKKSAFVPFSKEAQMSFLNNCTKSTTLKRYLSQHVCEPAHE